MKAAGHSEKLGDGISLVYSFYEFEMPERGLSAAGSKKMAYKSRFTPQEYLTYAGWVRVRPRPGT